MIKSKINLFILRIGMNIFQNKGLYLQTTFKKLIFIYILIMIIQIKYYNKKNRSNLNEKNINNLIFIK